MDGFLVDILNFDLGITIASIMSGCIIVGSQLIVGLILAVFKVRNKQKKAKERKFVNNVPSCGSQSAETMTNAMVAVPIVYIVVHNVLFMIGMRYAYTFLTFAAAIVTLTLSGYITHAAKRVPLKRFKAQFCTTQAVLGGIFGTFEIILAALLFVWCYLAASDFDTGVILMYIFPVTTFGLVLYYAMVLQAVFQTWTCVFLFEALLLIRAQKDGVRVEEPMVVVSKPQTAQPSTVTTNAVPSTESSSSSESEAAPEGYYFTTRSYSASDDNHVSYDKDELVKILDKADPDWWIGELQNGAVGLIQAGSLTGRKTKKNM